MQWCTDVQYTHWLRPRNPSSPLAFGLNIRGRYWSATSLSVTPWSGLLKVLYPTNKLSSRCKKFRLWRRKKGDRALRQCFCQKKPLAYTKVITVLQKHQSFANPQILGFTKCFEPLVWTKKKNTFILWSMFKQILPLTLGLAWQADYMMCKKQVSEIFLYTISIGSLQPIIHLNSDGHVWKGSNWFLDAWP